MLPSLTRFCVHQKWGWDWNVSKYNQIWLGGKLKCLTAVMYCTVPRWRSQSVGNSCTRSSTHSAVSLASASWSQQSSTVSRTSLTAVQSRHNSGNKGRALWRDTRTCICSNVGWWPVITQKSSVSFTLNVMSEVHQCNQSAHQLLPQTAICMAESLNRSGTCLNTVTPAPRGLTPEHKHRSVSVTTRSPWDSLPPPKLQVPYSAMCPPEITTRNQLHSQA